MSPHPLDPPRFDPPHYGPWSPGEPPAGSGVRPLRRRVRVFLLSFLLLAAASLVYDFSRPPEYRATARVRIDFPADGDSADERRQSARAAFLTEVQILGGQTTVAAALERLAQAGFPLGDGGGPEAADFHRTLAATPLEGTTLVELDSTGTRPEELAPFLNTLIDTYRERLSERYRHDSAGEAQQAQNEADALGARVADKRRLLDAFRARHDIVSLERDENQALKRVKGLGESLNAANEKLAAAEARQRALHEAAAAGRPAPRGRDNAGVANLEQRASQLREEMHEMERRFTPDFLAFDPRAQALKNRIANLDEQIVQARENGRQASVAEADEDVAMARANLERLSQQATGDRRNVQQFAARLGEFKAMQDELTGLEAMHRAAVVRATRLNAAEQVRAPLVTTLDPAQPPTEPWRPQYARDAAIGVAASLLLALLATWIVELFHRTALAPSLVVAPTWLTSLDALPARGGPRLAEARPAALLPQTAPLPRELDRDEIALLLAELPDDARMAAAGLLSGLAPSDLARLQWDAVDLAAGRLTLSDRALPMPPRLHDELCRQRERDEPADDAPVFAASDTAALDAALLYAAHDAGIDAPEEVCAAALRHSYVAHLVRQGVRFAELPRLVGPLPADTLAAYSPLSPTGKKRAADEIDAVHPALREADPA